MGGQYIMLGLFFEMLFGIIALFAVTRFLGKRQLSQLTAFDFIAAVLLGELVGNALFDPDAGILDIAYVVILFGLILYVIELITQKFKGSRYILEGKPSFIIHKGLINYDEMKKNKIDVGELQHMLRNKDVFAVQDVEYAILETNGQLSVLTKAPLQLPTKSDLEIPAADVHVAITIISDGEIIEDNIAELNMTEQWVKAELQRQQYNSITEVFYAEWLEGKGLFILPYTNIKTKEYNKKVKPK